MEDVRKSVRAKKKCRKSYPAAFKLQVIQTAKELGNNSEAARQHGVPEKLVRDWRKDETKLSNMPRGKKADRKSTVRLPEVDKSPDDWLRSSQDATFRVRGNMASGGAGIGPTVQGHTHPRLAELHQKACAVVDMFEHLPGALQMDGLDLLQGVVNSVIQKITAGRVTAVKFVPVAGASVSSPNGPPPNHVVLTNHIKQEVEDDEYHGNDSSDPGNFHDNQADNPGNRANDHGNTESNQGPQRSYQVDIHSNETSGAMVISDVHSASPKPKAKGKAKSQKKSSQTETNKTKPKSKTGKGATLKVKLNPVKFPNRGAVCPVSADEPKEMAEEVTKSKTGRPSAKSPNAGKKKSKNDEVTARKTNVKKTKKPPGKDVEDHAGAGEGGEEGKEESVKEEMTKEPAESRSQQNSIMTKEDGSPKSKEEIRALFPATLWVQTPKKRKSIEGEARFECEDCDYKTNTKFHFASHRLRHTKERRHTCEVCDKTFTAASTVRRHMLTHADKEDRPFPCPVCPKKFIDMPSLRTHAVVHTGEKLYPCPFDGCSKVYTCHSNLSRHKRVHTGEMPYVCKYDGCDVRFRDQSSLKLHHLKHTGEKPCACRFCGMAFRTSSDKLRHERTHTNERNFQCDICHKKFVQGWHVKQHMRMHDDVRPYQCELCGKRMRTKSSWQHHMRMHAGVKRFQCDTCHKLFTTKTYLANHQVIHTKDKPFKCKTCGSAFNQFSNLKRHERMHSDVIRYKCKYCNKGFKYINSWRYHQESIHEGVQHTCEKCGVSFRCKRSMKNHRCAPVKLSSSSAEPNNSAGHEESGNGSRPKNSDDVNKSDDQSMNTRKRQENWEAVAADVGEESSPDSAPSGLEKGSSFPKRVKIVFKRKRDLVAKNNKRKSTTPVKKSLKARARRLLSAAKVAESESGMTASEKGVGDSQGERSPRNSQAVNGCASSDAVAGGESGETCGDGSVPVLNVVIKQEVEDEHDVTDTTLPSDDVTSEQKARWASSTAADCTSSPAQILSRDSSADLDPSMAPNEKMTSLVSTTGTVADLNKLASRTGDNVDISQLSQSGCRLEVDFNSPSKGRNEMSG